MSTERVIVVAVEDSATAGVVGAAAAHIAMDQDAAAVILLHLLDNHPLASGIWSLSLPVPVVESMDEGESVLALAEAALRAEYAALGRPVPSIRHEVSGGAPTGTVIAQIATDAGATAIVVGARRPHIFGRLAHPDVRASIVHHTGIPVHVAALQADAVVPAGGEVR